MRNKIKKVFITGAGTSVGKTYLTCSLIDLIIKKGFKVSPYKPIETGCKKIKNKLIPNDSKKFYKLVNKDIDIELINPYRFQQPISPNRAIQLSKKKINIKNYIEKVKKLPKNDFLIIEGAGGLCSPISSDGLNIDLIKRMSLKTILIVKDEIGAINNVLLNIEILKKYKIGVIAIILNRIILKQPVGMNNLLEIKTHTAIPIIQMLNYKNYSNAKSLSLIFKLLLQS
ncbi:MAG: dethiobiotin synthase [Gammaproteobacteria bacterium]